VTDGRPSFSARIALLDKQIVDCDRLPIGRVDDAELAFPDDGGPPRIEALLVGAEPLGDRVGGGAGRLMAAGAARLRGRANEPPSIDPRLVEKREPMVTLRVPFTELPQVAALERWLAERLQRAPGAGDAPQ
jgi:hypothetical protein